MRSLSKVVWYEGMHLAQHTFQTQSRYFEDAIQFAVSHLFVKPYGVAGLELDTEALRNGTVSLIHARGVMPDGLSFLIPEGDPAPPALEIRDLFSPTVDSHLVQLSIPGYRAGEANCSLQADGGDSNKRYVAHADVVSDDITGQDVKSVSFAQKNFRLTLQGGSTAENAVVLPIARVRRDGTGHFIYDPHYIPPSLQIGASPRLMQLLQRLVEILDSKSQAMLAARASSSRGLVEYASQEVASFWLSHTIHSSLAPLRHHLQSRTSHPEQLHLDLSRLAGALCTFALESHPRALPLYDHDELAECFGALDQHIRSHLEVILPTGYLTIPLQRAANNIYTGQVPDKRSFGPSRWFLGVRSALAPADLIRAVPQLVKVCAQKHLLRLVKEAYPGLTLDHVTAPPAAIAPRTGTQYFSIARTGPCWDAMAKSGDVGIYLPDAIRDPELELRVLPEA